MLKLKDVTLLVASSVDLPETVKAFEHCCKLVEFADQKILTHDTTISPYAVEIPPLESILEYSEFCMYELYDYFDTSHCLVIQADGYILRPDMWHDGYLNYDWIGAPWFHGDSKHPVGNGGFSLRSKRICEITARDEIFQDMQGHLGEDHVICRVYGDYLRKAYDINISPVATSTQFSFESIRYDMPTFGFHGKGWLNSLDVKI